jgi:hypothetical protein
MSEQEWTNYVRDIASGAVYNKRVKHYHEYCEESTLENNLLGSLHSYLDFLHEEGLHCGSTMFGINSMICAWFIHRHNISPCKQSLTLVPKLKRWLKEHETVKAETFTLAEMQKFWTEAPDDHNWLLKKAILALGVNGCLRRTEIKTLKFENIVFDATCTLVTIYRAKFRGPKRVRIN